MVYRSLGDLLWKGSSFPKRWYPLLQPRSPCFRTAPELEALQACGIQVLGPDKRAEPRAPPAGPPSKGVTDKRAPPRKPPPEAPTKVATVPLPSPPPQVANGPSPKPAFGGMFSGSWGAGLALPSQWTLEEASQPSN